MSPALIATCVALPVVVLAVFLIAARFSSSREPTKYLEAVSAPHATDARCVSWLAQLPEQLDTFRLQATTVGYRWYLSGADVIEMRCGVTRPAQLARTSALTVVNNVQWLQVTPTGPAADVGSYWFAVDREPYVELWLPFGSGTAAIQSASEAAIAKLSLASLNFG